jgi:hypothetical protein
MKLDRRTLLKGIGGAVVGLPLLECMEAYAQTTPGTPRRYAILFAGQALGGDGYAKTSSRVNGTSVNEGGHFIAPAETGRGYTLTSPLQPLSALRDDFSIVSGLRIPYNTTNTDGSAVPTAGAFRDFHGGGCSPLLSGTRSTEGRYTCNGPSSDQVVAQMNAGQTNVESLVYRAQPAFYISGYSFSGRQYMSYRAANSQIEATVSPRIAWNNLFSGFTPGDPAEAARNDFAERGRLSVLDLISGKRQRLLGRVGMADRRRLERHFDEIRALELRIQATPPEVSGECQIPPDPGADPAVGGDNAGAGSDTIATNTGYSEEDTRSRLFADLIHMAFTCDLVRAATLQITVFQSHMNVYPVTSALGMPIRADLHEVGHNGDANNRGQIAVSTCLRWHIGIYAYLLQKMRDTPEGGGNLLDNSAIVFMSEAGHGRQLNDATSDNATHSVEEMALLVAGRAGGLAPGQHIAGAGRHPVQVLLSGMRAVGYTGDTLGQVTGHIPELFG